MDNSFNITAIVLLLAANGFYVAAELHWSRRAAFA